LDRERFLKPFCLNNNFYLPSGSYGNAKKCVTFVRLVGTRCSLLNFLRYTARKRSRHEARLEQRSHSPVLELNYEQDRHKTGRVPSHRRVIDLRTVFHDASASSPHKIIRNVACTCFSLATCKSARLRATYLFFSMW